MSFDLEDDTFDKPLKRLKQFSDLDNINNNEKRKNFGKNPNVDTSFLPDVEREEKIKEIREKLIEDYKELK